MLPGLFLVWPSTSVIFFPFFPAASTLFFSGFLTSTSAILPPLPPPATFSLVRVALRLHASNGLLFLLLRPRQHYISCYLVAFVVLPARHSCYLPYKSTLLPDFSDLLACTVTLPVGQYCYCCCHPQSPSPPPPLCPPHLHPPADPPFFASRISRGH